jgi:predicted CoA-substrate-specific enzyme activase
MISAGLDVGSRTIALVLLDDQVVDSAVVETGVRPLERCRESLEGRNYQRLMVTGYGRHLVAPALGGDVVSEIGAYARGASHLHPDCGTLIDIGGQDSKVISISNGGRVAKFEMNDRCAAGTGRFLEVMADTLELEIGELGDFALTASQTVKINSLCTVFAESEAVSLIARGEEPAAIALALHQAVASRVAGMVRRLGLKERAVFAGGAARNRCLEQLLANILEVEMTVPREPQLVGALGAALLASSQLKKTTLRK